MSIVRARKGDVLGLGIVVDCSEDEIGYANRRTPSETVAPPCPESISR
jgi:hypothetical protein